MNRNWKWITMAIATGLVANTATFAADPTDEKNPAKPAGAESAESSAIPGPTAGLLSGSDIIGQAVENAQGEKVGRINDLMIDPASGRIEYGLVNVGGGFLGVGSKVVAMPWSEFSQNSTRHDFVLAVTKDALAQAPRFDRSAWEKRQYEPTAGPAAPTGAEGERPMATATAESKVEHLRGTIQQVNTDDHTVRVKKLLTTYTFQIESARADDLSKFKPGDEVDIWYRDQNGMKTIQNIRAAAQEDEPASQPEPE